jgi:hypothetical protein
VPNNSQTSEIASKLPEPVLQCQPSTSTAGVTNPSSLEEPVTSLFEPPVHPTHIMSSSESDPFEDSGDLYRVSDSDANSSSGSSVDDDDENGESSEPEEDTTEAANLYTWDLAVTSVTTFSFQHRVD